MESGALSTHLNPVHPKGPKPGTLKIATKLPLRQLLPGHVFKGLRVKSFAGQGTKGF